MSIVNEALKKAAREDPLDPRGEKQRLSFSSKTSFINPLLFKVLPVLFLVLILAYAFIQPDLLNQWWSRLRAATQATKMAPAITESTPVQSSFPGVDPSAPHETEIVAAQRATSVQEEAARRLKVGIQFFHNKKFKEAEEEFTKVVSLQPENAMAYNNLGLVLKAQGRSTDAESQYLVALQINPKYPEALNNLGLLYDQQNRVKEAVQQYRKAIEIAPSYPEVHFNYAQTLERAGYPEEARRHYQAFLAMGSEVPSSIRLRMQQHLDALP
jgi:Flp pilus assembly protein TadD